MININLDFASLINDKYYTLYSVSNSYYNLSFHNIFTENCNLKKASLMHNNYTDLRGNSKDYNDDTFPSLEYDSILDGDLYVLTRNSSVRTSVPVIDILNESQLSLNNLKEFYNNYHSFDIFNIFSYFDEEDL